MGSRPGAPTMTACGTFTRTSRDVCFRSLSCFCLLSICRSLEYLAIWVVSSLICSKERNRSPSSNLPPDWISQDIGGRGLIEDREEKDTGSGTNDLVRLAHQVLHPDHAGSDDQPPSRIVPESFPVLLTLDIGQPRSNLLSAESFIRVGRVVEFQQHPGARQQSLGCSALIHDHEVAVWIDELLLTGRGPVPSCDLILY